MDIGDLIYIIIFIVVIISGAFSKSKEKKDKNAQRQKSIFSAFLSGEEIQAEEVEAEELKPTSEFSHKKNNEKEDKRGTKHIYVDKTNENDVLINEVAKKIADEEARRKEKEITHMQKIADLLNSHEDMTDHIQRAGTHKKTDESKELIIEELDDEDKTGYNVDFSDPEQVRNAIISAEILNKKY